MPGSWLSVVPLAAVTFFSSEAMMFSLRAVVSGNGWVELHGFKCDHWDCFELRPYSPRSDDAAPSIFWPLAPDYASGCIWEEWSATVGVVCSSACAHGAITSFKTDSAMACCCRAESIPSAGTPGESAGRCPSR